MNALEVDAPAFPGNFDREMTQGGWSLRRLSKASGIDKNTLHSWRHGRTRVRIDNVNTVARAMRVNPLALLGSTRATPTPPTSPPPAPPRTPDPAVAVVRELATLAAELRKLSKTATPDLLAALEKAAELAER